MSGVECPILKFIAFPRRGTRDESTYFTQEVKKVKTQKMDCPKQSRMEIKVMTALQVAAGCSWGILLGLVGLARTLNNWLVTRLAGPKFIVPVESKVPYYSTYFTTPEPQTWMMTVLKADFESSSTNDSMSSSHLHRTRRMIILRTECEDTYGKPLVLL